MKKWLPIAIPESLFVLYFWGLAMLRPLLQQYQDSSTLILALFAFLLVSFFVAYLAVRRDQVIEKPVIAMSGLLVVILADAVFRYNLNSYMLMYEFIYFGFVPVMLLSKVSDVRKLLVYFAVGSVVAFASFGFDPLQGYAVFSDYMGYGYKLALPAFLGIFIGFHYLKMRWMIVFEVLSFLSLMMFASRSALLAAVIFILIYIFVWHSFSVLTTLRRLVVFAFLLTLAYLNIDWLMDNLFRYTSEVSFRSYAIQKLNYFLASGSADEVFFSGRIKIWNEALNMFYDQPGVGHGMGKFLQRFDYYPHNIFLDVLVAYGILGFLVVLYFISRSVATLSHTVAESRIFGILLLALCFPKLLFSMMFISDTAFWCFFMLYLFPFARQNAVKLPNQMPAIQ
jgi:O-antigen ligase